MYIKDADGFIMGPFVKVMIDDVNDENIIVLCEWPEGGIATVYVSYSFQVVKE